jgi:malate dehydrogenase (oxaloacetate-decarboxylating)
MQHVGSSSAQRISTRLRGREVLRDPALNKGVAFPLDERKELGLNGILPPAVLDLAAQAARAYARYQQLPDDLSKAVMLGALHSRNHVLYFRVLTDHLSEMLPIVYTPTIGTVIQQYSGDFRRPGGIYLSIDDPDGIGEAFTNFGLTGDDVDLIVVTDGEGILGIGDWGAGGIAIAIGKLAVYTAAAGIDPGRVLPVVLDTGTNNQELLDDPVYIGNRHRRVTGERYDTFVDSFVQCVDDLFPAALLHWEDFGAGNATRILQKYRSRICTFNDDMQGTGAVVLAAVLAASAGSGTPMPDHRVVVFGAGTAGVGIADQIRDAMIHHGLPETDAAKRFWCLGRSGLLIAGKPGLRDFQQPYARPADEVRDWERDDRGAVPLEEVVRRVRPTIMIGTSGTPGAFTREVVQEMARHVARPVILALSNPTSLAEAVPADLLTWSEGRAMVATGSPFPPLTYERVTHIVAQANNALVFPGLGLGAIVSGARLITDGMLTAAARAVADLVDASAPGAPLLPEVNDLRRVSAAVAIRVAEAAAREGVARHRHDDWAAADWAAAVAEAMWAPVYRPVRGI